MTTTIITYKHEARMLPAGDVKLIRPLTSDTDERVVIEIPPESVVKAIQELAKKVADFNRKKINIARKIHAMEKGTFKVTQQRIESK